MAAFQCQVVTSSLPTESAKTGMLTYLSRCVPTVPRSEGAGILHGLRPKESWAKGGSLVSAVSYLQPDGDIGPPSHGIKLGQQKDPDQGQGGPRKGRGTSRTSVLAQRVSLVCKTQRKHRSPGTRIAVSLALLGFLQPFDSDNQIPTRNVTLAKLDGSFFRVGLGASYLL